MRDLDWSNVVADGEAASDHNVNFTECGKPCVNPEHATGTMLSGGMPCWLTFDHDGKCVCPMCPDAFEVK